MAEEILVKEVLPDQMLAAGEGLTRRLDQDGWPVYASLWLYDAESNRWRLLIVSPAVDAEGPLAAYKKIDATLKAANLPQSLLRNIAVVTTMDPRYRALTRSYIIQGPEIRPRRIGPTGAGGQFFDDIYLYRLMPPPAA